MNKQELNLQIELTDILCSIQDAYFYLLYEDRGEVLPYLNRCEIIVNLKSTMDNIYNLIPKTKGVYMYE